MSNAKSRMQSARYGLAVCVSRSSSSFTITDVGEPAKMISQPVPPRSRLCGRIAATCSTFIVIDAPSIVVHLIQFAMASPS